ncbi:hypothetical protein KY290_018799 [Solanum tuberosum]|uniref:Uncharacterized protein n=1 Tax=Solanum tuberosum TaxID=4113 RepID=A0ABQ7VH28_SOLTU|nr:hypothetical protein KY290_018799 [Solanum tuberosum]
MVVDDFKEIIKIIVCRIDSISNDQCAQFPHASGVNLFIVTPSGCLQVHHLHPATSVHALLFVMDAFQLFRSISYMCPTIEPAESLIEYESTISIWDPGISPEFMTIIGSTENEETHTLFEILKQLVGNQIGTARRQDKWMMLSSPSYFVYSIFYKALYNLSQTNNSDWSMILQPYSYSSPVTLWGEQFLGVYISTQSCCLDKAV